MNESQMKDAGFAVLGTTAGVVTGTLVERSAIPYKRIINMALGVAMIYGGTQLSGAASKIVSGAGVGHIIVGGLTLLKQATSATVLPTLSGMRGMPMLPEGSMIPEGALMGVEELQMSLV